VNALLYAATGAIIATAAVQLLGRTERSKQGEWHGTGLSAIGSVILGTFFLALGFLIAGAWSQSNTAQADTWKEARAITTLYATAGPTTRPAILTYTNTVRLQEMSTGGDTEAGRNALDDIRRRAQQYEPQAGKAQVLANLTAVQEAREARIEGAHAALPTALYTALLCAGCVVLLWPPLVGLQSTRRDTAALALVGILVGTACWLAINMANPYTSTIHINDDAYTWAHQRIGQMGE
jgi:hypothetical protein